MKTRKLPYRKKAILIITLYLTISFIVIGYAGLFPKQNYIAINIPEHLNKRKSAEDYEPDYTSFKKSILVFGTGAILIGGGILYFKQ